MYVFIETSAAVSKFSLTCEDKDCTFCLLKKAGLLVGLHQLSDFFLPRCSYEKMEFQNLCSVEGQQCLKLQSSVQSNKAQTQVQVGLALQGMIPSKKPSSASLTIFSEAQVPKTLIMKAFVGTYL